MSVSAFLTMLFKHRALTCFFLFVLFLPFFLFLWLWVSNSYSCNVGKFSPRSHPSNPLLSSLSWFPSCFPILSCFCSFFLGFALSFLPTLDFFPSHFCCPNLRWTSRSLSKSVFLWEGDANRSDQKDDFIFGLGVQPAVESWPGR